MGKYDKYILEGAQPWFPPSEGGFGAAIAHVDDTHIKGCHFYFINWISKKPPKGLGAWSEFTHGPHIHKDAELLIHVGTNPDDPMDLGAEVEMYMGKEMEKYTITKTCVVYIPPGLIHCPWIIKRVDRPWIMINVNQGPVHTEKSYPQIVPEKDRDKMLFVDDGYDDKGYRAVLPKGLKMDTPADVSKQGKKSK